MTFATVCPYPKAAMEASTTIVDMAVILRSLTIVQMTAMSGTQALTGQAALATKDHASANDAISGTKCQRALPRSPCSVNNKSPLYEWWRTDLHDSACDRAVSYPAFSHSVKASNEVGRPRKDSTSFA